jgi:hypothetical protein
MDIAEIRSNIIGENLGQGRFDLVDTFLPTIENQNANKVHSKWVIL